MIMIMSADPKEERKLYRDLALEGCIEYRMIMRDHCRTLGYPAAKMSADFS